MIPPSKKWVQTTLGAVCNVRTGKTPATANQTFFSADVPFFKPGDLDGSDPLERSENSISHAGAKIAGLLPKDTVLVTCIGNLGKVGILAVPACCNQQINAILPSPQVEPRFLFYWAKQIRAWLEENASATTILIINKGRFEKAPLPLPPIGEQRRIVAKLDELLDRSQQARRELDHIPKLVARYKQAVLAEAFSGEMTTDWREQNSVDTPTLPTRASIDGRIPSLSRLPHGWTWRAVGDVASVAGGLTKNPNRKALPSQIPYLRVANVYANELRLDDIEHIGVRAAEAARVNLQHGDLLIVEGNGSIDQIGRVALWQNEIPNCGHQNHIIRARTTPVVVPKFLLYWLLSPLGRAAIEVVASSTSGLHTLSLSKVNSLPVPLCSPEEMAEIVSRIEATFGRIDEMLLEATRADNLLGRLNQAMLAKAFRGELVTDLWDEIPVRPAAE